MPPCLSRRVCTAALLVASLSGAAGCTCGGGSGPDVLILFHAGSLSVPWQEVSALFEARHPGVKVRAEAAGSRDSARKVSDLKRPCDVLGSADYQVAEDLLMPEHAAFNIRFATNSMTLAYSQRSRGQDRINEENWPQVLLEPGMAFGRSDPERDPCGYRTVMLFQLAEQHLGVPGLAARLERQGGRRFIRPKETDLLALLESGQIDYLFIYTSVARQHGLKHLSLPAEINLGSVAMAARYARARVSLSGKAPGERVIQAGAPIAYSVTIPRNAPRRQLAEDYLDLLLSPEGAAIMARHGQLPISPPLARGEVPPRLRRRLAREGAAP